MDDLIPEKGRAKSRWEVIMEINFVTDGERADVPRQYVAVCRMINFRGHKNVETHLFRNGWTDEEMEAVANLDVVAGESSLPEEIKANVSRTAALECLLETFTRREAERVARYLEERYAGQIARLDICPIEFPLPLGITALGKIPATDTGGFIEFARAKNYPLDFELRGYYVIPEDSK